MLEARDSTQGSYAGKSILGARDVIKRGTIGKGQSVLVRETSGYQTNVVEQSSPPPPSLPPDVKVFALINAETASWNVN